MSMQTNFINSIKNGAIESMNKHGVLASITIAQAILESGWGKSTLSKDYYNLFGVKAFGNVSFVTMSTKEYVRGKHVTINAKFRKYNNYSESIEDHALFLVNNPRYRKNGFFNSKNYIEQANSLVKAGYATDPNYAKQLIQLIEQYNLYEYDKEQFKELRYTEPKMRGDNVKTIQIVLKKIGYNIGTDGSFGANTQDAVLKYQKEHKFLNQRGIVDKATWNSIMVHK